jgi:broad-specificity NMP kinase
MTGSIFFITGASGVGKTTLKCNLDILYSQDNKTISIHDFDEGGVPKNANAYWRQERTNHWLKLALKNAKKNISTIVCGVSVPLEVLGSSDFEKGIPLHFGFLRVSRALHAKRLKLRDWTVKLIKSDLNWSAVLTMCVEKEKGFLLDTTKLSPEEVAQEFSTWINLCLDVNARK